MSNLENGLIESVRLCGGHHAIDRLCLGVEWETPLDQEAMSYLSSVVQEIAELPRRIEVRASESATKEAPPQSAEPSDLVEIALDDSKGADESEDGKTLEIIIKQTGVFFGILSSTYVSWTDTKSKAARLTQAILEKVLEQRSLSSVGLQVVDSFRFDRGLNLSLILKKDSEFIPAAVINKSVYTRFDQSYYEIAEADDFLLTNYQVMTSPVDSEDQLIIACLHRFDLNSHKELSISELHGRYDELYSMNKHLVGSLLSDELAKRIGIYGGDVS